MREREKPSAAVTKSNPQSGSASEDDSKSGSETESGNHSSSTSDFTIKPIVSKPVNNVVMPSKKTVSAKPVAAPSFGLKRPAETEPSPNNSKKGVAASSNVAPFLEFIKNDLQVDLSTDQLAEKLTDKIKRLKKKYQAGNDGKDPVFSKPHGLKCFELCKNIWGSEA
ncbi:hypothetical protein ACFX11_002945 [Malus domestica]